MKFVNSYSKYLPKFYIIFFDSASFQDILMEGRYFPLISLFGYSNHTSPDYTIRSQTRTCIHHVVLGSTVLLYGYFPTQSTRQYICTANLSFYGAPIRFFSYREYTYTANLRFYGAPIRFFSYREYTCTANLRFYGAPIRFFSYREYTSVHLHRKP